jgi:hypothetical protein
VNASSSVSLQERTLLQTRDICWGNVTYHPAILFLSFFPVVVLFVFSYLVARHHMKLYGPSDYKNQEDFFRGIKIPSALDKNIQGVATSDPLGTETNKDTMESIDRSYKTLVEFGFVLVHLAEVLHTRTSPKSGRYRVRVWVECIDSSKTPLASIDSVTYHVWEDFSQPIVTTSDASSSFDLWMNVYGEFPVLAVIRTKTGKEIELQRFIDLPGRPPD